MEYHLLGNSGLKVSLLSMGAMTFGRETTKKDSMIMLDIFADAGGNFIDTANVYSDGLSEEILGEWLKGKKREDFVIATKVRFPMGTGPNDQGLSRKHILDSVQASLTRLRLDYVDVLYAHCWDHLTPLDETMGTFTDLISKGNVRYAAASNYTPSQLQFSADLSTFSSYEPYIALQAKYNLLVRSPEWELLEVCEDNGIGLVVWGPLLGGWLSGRYTRNMTEPPDGRVKEAEKQNWSEKWTRYNNEKTWKILDAVRTVAEKNNKSPAQVAINWLTHQHAVASIIIGASKISHIEDNLGGIDWFMNEDDYNLLDAASAIECPYPYDFIAEASDKR